MPKIVVRSPFKLRLPDPYRELDFLPGEHEVTAEVADHWFTRAFSELLPAPDIAPSPEPDAPVQPDADAATTAESEPTKRKKE